MENPQTVEAGGQAGGSEEPNSARESRRGVWTTCLARQP